MKIGTCISFPSVEHVEESLQQLKAHGFDSFQLIGWDPEQWTDENAAKINALLKKYEATISAFWCGWVGPTAWNFYEGQLLLGLVPAEYREVRV